MQYNNKLVNIQTEITNNLNLNIRLKTPKEIEKATNSFISTLQGAAKKTIPHLDAQTRIISIPIENKKLISEKKRQERNDSALIAATKNSVQQYSHYISNLLPRSLNLETN